MDSLKTKNYRVVNMIAKFSKTNRSQKVLDVDSHSNGIYCYPMTRTENRLKRNGSCKFANHVLMCFLAKKKYLGNPWPDLGSIRKRV